MYIFQIEDNVKVVRQEIEMKKFNGVYYPTDETFRIPFVFFINNPKEEELDTLVPFGNDKYIMFSKNGDVSTYINKVIECRKKELEFRKLQVQNLENLIDENKFETLIIEN